MRDNCAEVRALLSVLRKAVRLPEKNLQFTACLLPLQSLARAMQVSDARGDQQSRVRAPAVALRD